MFQGLRPNSIFYILDKSGTPKLKIGQVVSVSNPQAAAFSAYQGYGAAMETTVDVKVKLQDEEIELKKLPSNALIANIGNLIVSDNKDSMLSEVESMMRQSNEILNSKSYHEEVLSNCEKIVSVLNPQIAKEKAQEKKIENLESEVGDIKGTLSNIETLLQRALKKSNNQN